MKISERIMTALADFVCKYYKTILLVFIVILIASIMAMSNIEIITNVEDLLPEGNLKVKGYDEISEIFQGGNSIIVAIEGTDKTQMKNAAEFIKSEVLANAIIKQDIKSVTTKIDKDFMLKWAMMVQNSEDIEDTADSLSSYNILPLVKSVNKTMNDMYTGDDAEEDISNSKQENNAVAFLTRIESFMMNLTDLLKNNLTNTRTRAQELADTFILGEQYTFSYDNTMLLLSINTSIDATDTETLNKVMKEIKSILDESEKAYKGITSSYTGEIGMEHDERSALGLDMVIPSIIAFVIIILLFLFSFNKFRVVVFTMGTLIASILINYGIIGITLKEINLLTSVMASLLVGMGIDYGVQVATNFMAFQDQGYAPKDVVHLTFIRSGIGSLMAAITTAASFYVIAFTKSKALQHFGIIAGNGILICFILMIFVVPSLFLLFSKNKTAKVKRFSIPFDKMANIPYSASKIKPVWLFIILAVTIVMLVMSFSLDFEYDMIKLQPQEAESIVTQRVIMDKFSSNVFYSMIVANTIDEARKYTEEAEKLSMISSVNSISSFIQPSDVQKKSLMTLKKLKSELPIRKTYNYTASDILYLADQLQELEWNIIELGDLSVAGLGEDNKIIKKRNNMIREILGSETGQKGNEVFKTCIELLKSNPQFYADKLNVIDPYFSAQYEANVKRLYSADRMMTINDIPEDYRLNLYDEKTGKFLIQMLPKNYVTDTTKNLLHYTNTIDTINPEATGLSQLAISWFAELFRETKKSTIYILFLVLLIMYLNFRKIKYTLLALIPLFLSLIWTGGILYIFKIKLSGLTVSMIPLIIGIGISYGTYTTHRFIVEGKNLAETLKYTTKPVFLSAITTIIGFGTLGFFAKIEGLAQIGILLFTGIVCSYLTTIIILPLLLKIVSMPDKRKTVSQDDKSTESEFIK